MKEMDFSCALCQSTSYEMLYNQESLSEQDDCQDFMVTDNSYGRHYPIVKCSSCDFVTTLCPNDEFITSKYAEVEDPNYLAEEKNRRLPFIKLLKQLERLGQGTGKLLDIGSFCGLLPHEAKSRGFDVVAVEPSKWAVQQARKRYNIKIIESVFPAEQDIGKDFKFVTLVDVIEHVTDLATVLMSINQLMADDGIFTVVTPNFNSLARRIFGEKWWHIRIGHLHYFDRKSLAKLLQLTGFRVIKRKGYVWRFSFFYLVTRLLSGRALNLLNRMCKHIRAFQWLMNLSVPVNLFDSFEWYCTKEVP